jgi:hypothetical protein
MVNYPETMSEPVSYEIFMHLPEFQKIEQLIRPGNREGDEMKAIAVCFPAPERKNRSPFFRYP